MWPKGRPSFEFGPAFRERIHKDKSIFGFVVATSAVFFRAGAEGAGYELKTAG